MSSTEVASQHYNLKWTNHTNNILQMFSEHLQKEQLVDVTISCEGQFLKAHKMVLSACSPYFQELFSVHTVEHPLIIMNGVKFATLQQMIDFMYQGEIKVGDIDLDNLLTIAENMQIKGLCKIRREKNTSVQSTDTTQSSANILSNISPPKGRKRRKQSHSSVSMSTEGSSSESPVNGEHSSSNQASSSVIDKAQNAEDNKDVADKPEPKLLKLSVSQSEDKTIDKQGSKIPRPPNAFMIFANEWRKKLAVEHQGESNKEISVRLGNMWKSLPGNTKDLYYSAAKKADEDHKVKYPGYYYSPKEARLRKELRGSNSQRSSSSLSQSGGIMRDIDSTSLVKLVMPDTRTENSSTEEAQPDDVKVDSENFDISEDDSSNENSENSNSSVENLPSSSGTKE